MRALVAAALFAPVLSLATGPVAAQEEAVPASRVVVSVDVDFPGGDLGPIFDTTLDACQAACLANSNCGAFTYNRNSSACFPKTGATEVVPFTGAVSARILPTDPAVVAAAGRRAADLAFVGSRRLVAARQLAQTLGRLHSVNENTAAEFIAAAETARRDGRTMDQLRFTGAAVTLTDSPDLWLAYAELARTIEMPRSSDRSEMRRRAVSAAINAYLRSDAAPQRSAALVELALALEVVGDGRRMIDALRLAQDIQPRRDTEELLDTAIGKYGFRVVDTEVASDLADPRICARFNEGLVRTGVDYAPFVQLPDPGLTVEAEGDRICVAGVEHGSRYRIVLREGLPAASGEELARSVELTLYVRDRSPSVRFGTQAYVLPRGADAAVPVETVNVDTLDLVLHRVSDGNILRSFQQDYFGRQLYPYEYRDFDAELAEEVWRGTAEIGGELNADTVTRLPMGEVIGDLPPGLYVLRAALEGQDPYDWDSDVVSQWFVLSDLGMATFLGTDGLTVAVRGLSDARALEGVELRLLNRANAELGVVTTDANGVAVFPPGLTRGQGASAPALVIAETGDDMAFLSLTGPAFDLSDRGVEGREPAQALDVFLATDRGAYRAGETIFATALVRDGRAAAEPDVPLTAILTRPDGVEFQRQVSANGVAGGHLFEMRTNGAVPRGTWRLAVYADPEGPALAATSVLVEDLLPERIDFTQALPADLRAGDTVTLTLAANYLFGPPAPGMSIEGEARLVPVRALDGFPGYRFGRHDDLPGVRVESFGGWETGPDGTQEIDLTLPELDVPGQPAELRVTTRVSESSGRPVERRLTAPVTPDSALIGIKVPGGGDVPEGSRVTFDLVTLDPSLSAAPATLTWTVNRVTTRYQWYRDGGEWRWEPYTTRQTVASGTIETGADGRAQVSADVDWGRYEIVVERADGDYVASSQDFHAGWYVPADTSATPDFLDVSLDAEAYAVGDEAVLRIEPRFAGTALVTVMSNRVIAMQTVEVPAEGVTEVRLPVTEDWGAGAYVAAHLLRPMDVAAGRNPARALGLAHAVVDPGAKLLPVTLEVPEVARPRGPVTVGLVVDAPEGETAYVTIAAVDQGILNITGHQPPDPVGHYFGQRRLGVELRDLYGRLLDGFTGSLGSVRSGGDAMFDASMEAPPPTEELVAYFSGPVTIGPDGRAEVTFEMPPFNGTVRMMAIAWTDTAVGQADAELLVRDPVVVTASVPRFLQPGDRSRLLLEITHAEGPVGEMALSVGAEGLALASSGTARLSIAEGETIRTEVAFAAIAAGTHRLVVEVVTPGGEVLTKPLTIPVRSLDPVVAETTRLTLAPGETFTFDDAVLAGLRPGTAQATLALGPLARLDAPGLLAALDRYPYGCTEQVTSRAMPLLYLADVAEAMGLGTADDLQERVDQAVTLVLARQTSSGAFGLWRPRSGDLWLDAYVTDFLDRARRQGFDVPEIALETAMDNLRNNVNFYPDFDSGGEDLSYALMVLARSGEAAVGDLRYYADERAEAFTTPIAAAQLGAALAYYGDQGRADRMFLLAGEMIVARSGQAEREVWRIDYGTNRRDVAAVLALATEVGSTAVDPAALTARLALPTDTVSTQEATWTLLAANALIADVAQTGLLVNGAVPDGPLVSMRVAGEAPTEVANMGQAPAALTVTAYGVPVEPRPAGGNGYRIDRAWYTLDGARLDASEVASGTRLVTVLTVTPIGFREGRLMVDDPLPAGFEIDNPNLLSSGDIRALDWLDVPYAESTEFREDRFRAAIDRRSDEPFQLAYIVRAVSPGSYHHAAALVEDMYRPHLRGTSEPGQVTVTP